MKIYIEFYSFRPRIKVGMIYKSDSAPMVGDEIIIDKKFISQIDKKYFDSWVKNYSMTFRVKKRIWNFDEHKTPWCDHDLKLVLDWTEEESIEVEKYLDTFKKKNN